MNTMNPDKQKFRHELKYIISKSEKDVLMRRFASFMDLDAHAKDTGYFIRSLYFDDRDFKAYKDKQAGVDCREKYRIRIYDYSDAVIMLECKKKVGNYINKESARLSKEELEHIIKGDYEFLLGRKEDVCKRFYVTRGLSPMVYVDYNRIPYVYRFGDVRITFDMNVRAGAALGNIFDKNVPVYDVLEPGNLIMEVKFTEYLPTVIRDIIQPLDSIYVAASKYTLCVDKMTELHNTNTLLRGGSYEC